MRHGISALKVASTRGLSIGHVHHLIRVARHKFLNQREAPRHRIGILFPTRGHTINPPRKGVAGPHQGPRHRNYGLLYHRRVTRNAVTTGIRTAMTETYYRNLRRNPTPL